MNNVGWIFPGQGSQSARMGQKFMDRAPFVRVIDDISEATGRDIRAFITVLSDPDLKRTDRAQLGIFAVSMGIEACLRDAGLTPRFVAGHSLGHFSALTSAGVLSLQDAALLVDARGGLMRDAGEHTQGGMAVVQGLLSDQVADILAGTTLRVWPANLNLPTQIVVAGLASDMEAARTALVEAGGKWVALNVSGAFHSPLLATEAAAFANQIAQTKFATPECAIISNLNGQILRSPSEIALDLQSHMTSQVRWTDVMDRFVSLSPKAMIEVGPGKVLTGLMLRYAPNHKPNSTGLPALMDRAIGAQKTTKLERSAA